MKLPLCVCTRFIAPGDGSLRWFHVSAIVNHNPSLSEPRDGVLTSDLGSLGFWLTASRELAYLVAMQWTWSCISNPEILKIHFEKEGSRNQSSLNGWGLWDVGETWLSFVSPPFCKYNGYFLLFKWGRVCSWPWISSSSAFILSWETGELVGPETCSVNLWFDKTLISPGGSTVAKPPKLARICAGSCPLRQQICEPWFLALMW